MSDSKADRVLTMARRLYAATYTSGRSKIKPAILRGERDNHPRMERYKQEALDVITLRENGL